MMMFLRVPGKNISYSDHEGVTAKIRLREMSSFYKLKKVFECFLSKTTHYFWKSYANVAYNIKVPGRVKCNSEF